MPVARTPDDAELEWEECGAGDPLLLIAGQGVSRRTCGQAHTLSIVKDVKVLP